MALANHMATCHEQTVRPGDVVFFVADRNKGRWRQRMTAHVGLAVGTIEGDGEDRRISVLHMDLERIKQEDWSFAQKKGMCQVNLLGWMLRLDDVKRVEIIDHAVQIPTFSSIIIDSIKSKYNVGKVSGYSMGQPSLISNPAYPEMEGIYALSCSTFVHLSYLNSVGAIVDTSNLPSMSEEERAKLTEFLGSERFREYGPKGLADRIPSGVFPRLHPLYLAHAFHRDRYPLAVSDWRPLQDSSAFIPANPS